MDAGPGGESTSTVDHTSSRRRLVGLVGAGVGAVITAFFLVRLLGQPWPHFPPTYPDSFSYLKVATRGPFHPHFYFDERPIGYPFFLWLFGRSANLAVIAQTLLYVAAFWTLCRVVYAEMRSVVVGVLMVIFIAAVAIEPRTSVWNTLILSESLSTSLAMFSIAAWFRAAARPSKQTLTWAWVATGVWVAARDTNVLPAMVVIVPSALAIAWVSPHADRILRRRLVTGAVAITLLCGYVYVSQAVTLRNQYPMNNNVGMRILPNAATTKWFVQGGMPLDDALRARTNHNSWDDNAAFLKSPDLAKYRAWARGPGARRMAISMLALAPTWWKRLHGELPNILRDNNAGYDSYGAFKRFPKHMPAPLGAPRTNSGLWAWMLVAIGGLVVAGLTRRRPLLVTVVSLGLFSAIVDVWVSYIGDAMEVNRHLVGPLARLNVLMIIAVALGADNALSWWRDRDLRRAERVEGDGDEPAVRDEPQPVTVGAGEGHDVIA